jgi:hypothetical protein
MTRATLYQNIKRLGLLLSQHEANIPFTLVEALSADQEGARLIGEIPFI